ncbi:MAG: hypothetical protein Q4A75_02600 [Peptostreptococcaceae bacterium]|nr:hypothetical protein [Peptostreptococcaceae bacterium]
MEYLFERVAYLRGLCEGIGFSEETKEGKVLLEIVDVLGEFADAIVELSDRQDEIEEYVEAIDDDLVELEDDFYEEEDDGEVDYIELSCPSCGEEIEIDEDLLYDEESDIICPACDEVVISAVDEDFVENDFDLLDNYEDQE